MSRRAVALIGAGCVVAVAIALAVVAIVTSSSDSAAARWSAPARVPLPASAAASARASFDPSGRAHVAWVERRAGRWSLHTIDRGPRGDWSAPRTVVGDQPFSIYVADLAGDSRGDEAILWIYSGERRSVLSASVRAAGEEWGPEQAVSRVGRGRTGRLAMDERGSVTVAGRGLAGPGLWAVRRDPEEGWSAPVRVSPRGYGTDSPALSVAADGRATIVALLKAPGEPRRLFSVSADAAGAWGPPRVVPGSALATGPGVSVTANGDAFVSWGREVRGVARFELRLARRAREGAWSAPAVLDGPRAQPGSAAITATGASTGRGVAPLGGPSRGSAGLDTGDPGGLRGRRRRPGAGCVADVARPRGAPGRRGHPRPGSGAADRKRHRPAGSRLEPGDPGNHPSPGPHHDQLALAGRIVGAAGGGQRGGRLGLPAGGGIVAGRIRRDLDRGTTERTGYTRADRRVVGLTLPAGRT